jgi:hypothetical protein
MSSTTYGGVFREVPIVPFPCTILSLVRGMVVQWGSVSGTVGPWLAGTTPPLGVATGDADRDLLQVNVYCGKGCSVSIKCAAGIVPNPNDFLFWGATGLVSNVSDGNPPFARAVGVGFNGYVEAIII